MYTCTNSHLQHYKQLEEVWNIWNHIYVYVVCENKCNLSARTRTSDSRVVASCTLVYFEHLWVVASCTRVYFEHLWVVASRTRVLECLQVGFSQVLHFVWTVRLLRIMLSHFALISCNTSTCTSLYNANNDIWLLSLRARHAGCDRNLWPPPGRSYGDIPWDTLELDVGYAGIGRKTEGPKLGCRAFWDDLEELEIDQRIWIYFVSCTVSFCYTL